MKRLLIGLAIAGQGYAGEIISYDGLPASPAYKISQYADVAAKSGMVIIAAGSAHGVVGSAVFESYRLANGHQHAHAPVGKPMWVKTGELKGVQVFDQHSVASVTMDGTALSQAFFPKYAGVMAGDVVVEKQLAIEQGTAMTPQAELTYRQLFLDPNASATNLELSQAGRDQLKEVAEIFAGKRVGMLVVEGHTDQTGPSERNQVESYQRALAVRQILISEYGFDENRITAIGMGETEPKEDSYVPGFRETNRRVVVKVIE